MRITKRQLKRIINEELQRVLSEDKGWSEKVTKDAKWHPPKGLFTKSASSIVRALLDAPGGRKKAMDRLNFYINRGGDDLKNRDQLEKAKRKLREKE